MFNTLTNLCIALYCILLYCVVLNCVVLLIHWFVDIIQYNAMHKFVGVLDNPPMAIQKGVVIWYFQSITLIKPELHMTTNWITGAT